MRRAHGSRHPQVREHDRGHPAMTEVMPREREIVAAYRELGTLEKTGARFGISRERVRQIVVKYERLTGDVVPRTPKTGIRVPRRLWRCPDCDAERLLPPWKAARSAGRCSACAGIVRGRKMRKRLTDELIETAICRKLGGESWLAISTDAGYPPNGSYHIPRAVYLHLILRGRGDIIAQLWPLGVPWWLINLHGLPPRSDVGEAA